ncbi:dihydrolipoyl dehydrogenase family protein [Periweissella fabalis]|uniref:NAD(P)/FAD-dependent oxidoreductase n=1 Tax=Periweissella fabalis TaxID=1070421 RepID=A0A7X6N126_9LACO|nr:NAD(P)/FAD-dependent oxidoreductase [Periweissella fabalis]MCM0599543.1 NAD(P)/FAD-dependent oxidoreductase [Periweissella fabalis]NKZ23848.1 NAD(P)/FAD-dependent oxidoreductase [Periweissella fabalis]
MLKYNVGIIGSGSAGTSAAYGLQSAGKSVAVFEDYIWGGTCANMGCDPKKIIVNSIDVLRQAQLFQNEVIGKLALNWEAVMAKKQKYVDAHPIRTLDGLEGAGIETYHETPRFIDATTVELADGTQIQADTWILATGKRPTRPTFSGAQLAGTSEDFLNLPQMPSDITFIGGGYIAVEFASIAQFAGAQVHLLQHNQQILRNFEPWLVDKLVPRLTAQGIDFQFDTEVASLTKQDNRILVTTTDGRTFLTDTVIAAMGRHAAVEGLDLPTAGVEFDAKGIKVNGHLQSTNPHIFAAGDVAASGVPNLTPVAGYEARYLVSYLNGLTTDEISYPAISSAVYGHPRIAQVGVTTSEAQKRGYQVSDYDLRSWFNYMRLNDQAAARIIKHEGKIVGASVISEQADEIINMFVTAINDGTTAEQVANQIMTYPTMESDLGYFY